MKVIPSVKKGWRRSHQVRNRKLVSKPLPRAIVLRERPHLKPAQK